jgi:ABC-type bacteriocin/lantibiotic exporter with double-glycine peptidase domain
MRFSLPQRLALALCLCGTAFSLASTAVWLDVPFVKQAKDGCGAAVISMVMQYWNIQRSRSSAADADPALIQKELFSREARGIYASDLERYFKEHGFRAFAFTGDWDGLRTHLEKGRPLIVALKPAGGGDLHYVVVAGLDWEHNLVLVNDPAQKKLLKEERADFEKEWKAAKRWTLLAVPK